MGSWWGVVFHFAWWIIWFTFSFDLLVLTLWLSIEAILIGIVILMVQNKAEVEREKILEFYSKTALETAQRDLRLDEKFDRRQLEIIREIRQIRKDLHHVKNHFPEDNKKIK